MAIISWGMANGFSSIILLETSLDGQSCGAVSTEVDTGYMGVELASDARYLPAIGLPTRERDNPCG